MKKMIQIAVIISLISANSGYAGTWKNIQSLFTPSKLGPEWKKLEVSTDKEADLSKDLIANQTYKLKHSIKTFI
jgi:hypothetical protein